LQLERLRCPPDDGHPLKQQVGDCRRSCSPARAAPGRKLRTDTTVVETQVHYPTDSTLLGDGIRVLSRSLARIAAQCKRGTLEVVHHGRAVKHRLLEISRAAKCLNEASRERMQSSYQKLLALTRSVLRQAGGVVERWKSGRLKVVGS
jgi:hypothetical protein